MTRGKISLKRIENERDRKETFNKKIGNIHKKCDELCSKCEVEACIITYSYDNEGPIVWPSIEKANELIDRFETIPDIDQTKKMVNHEEYMKKKVAKLEDDIYRQEYKNKMMEASILMHRINHGEVGVNVIKNLQEVKLLHWFADEKLKQIARYQRLFPTLEELQALSIEEEDADGDGDGDGDGDDSDDDSSENED